MCFIILFLFITLVLENVWSIEILDYTSHIYFYDDKLLKEIYITIASNKLFDRFTYVFQDSYDSLKILDEDNNELFYIVKREGNLRYITIFFPKNISYARVKYVFENISYITFTKTENNTISKHYTVIISDIVQANVINYTMRIFVSKKYNLLDIIPYSDIKLGDNYYVIEFKNRRGLFKVALFLTYVEKVTIQPEKRITNYNHIVILTLLILTVIFVLRYYLRKIRFERVTKGLRDDEIYVLKIIMRKNGIEQKKIEEITNFSKAKVSKILSELEKRGLIKKRRIGNRNKIYINF